MDFASSAALAANGAGLRPSNESPSPAPYGELSRDFLARAWLIRVAEQRLLSLFAEGKLNGTVHTCIGQEFSALAVAESLRDGDLIFSNHRCHGHYIARTGDVDGLIAEVMGRQSGICGGRGGSQHICAPGFYSNGVQGGIVPVAAGLAFGLKLRGNSNLAVVFIGDGTLGEGAVYETFNLASKWELPLWIVLENNGYAQSTSQRTTLAGDIDARAAAFGISVAHGSTGSPAALLEEAAACAERIRRTGRPAFLRIDTQRLMAHSKGDDDRDPAEVRRYWAADPLTRFETDRPSIAAELQSAAQKRVAEAVTRAEQSPCTLALPPTPIANDALRWKKAQIPQPDRLVQRLHAAIRNALEANEKVLLIGEDIEGPYGGAFKATKNLSLDFPGRVRNAPISESAIVGLGNGLALQGYRPIVEIMFGDFLTLAFDQWLNHASKFRYTYNDQVRIPLIIRTPMGGKRGYGATHSQSIEKHYLGTPETQVLALNLRVDPCEIYGRLVAQAEFPTLVVENKLLYGMRVSDETPAGFLLEHSDEPFPTVRLRPGAAADVTILCYGGMMPDAEKAAEELFDQHDIVAEIICPTQLYPFDPRALLDSVRGSGRLVIVEEGQSFAAFGAEAVAQVLERAPGILRGLRRVGPPAHAIPSCAPLEKTLLPSAPDIVRAACELVQHG